MALDWPQMNWFDEPSLILPQLLGAVSQKMGWIQTTEGPPPTPFPKAAITESSRRRPNPTHLRPFTQGGSAVGELLGTGSSPGTGEVALPWLQRQS